MSVDFGGKLFLKIRNETFNSLCDIKDICFMSDVWSDNKTGQIEGYARKTIFFDTKEYQFFYIIDNKIFSGFVDSERIVSFNKKTNERKTFRLEKQNESNNPSFSDIIKSSYQFKSDDYVIDAAGSEEYEINRVAFPFIHFISSEEDYIVVDSLINDIESYIIFKFYKGNLINVMHYNKETFNMQTMSIKEPDEEEYINALKSANDRLRVYDKNDNYRFETKVNIKFYNEIIDLDNKKTSNDKYEQIKKLCENVSIPYIPKLNIAKFDGKTLTLPTGFSYISKYLVKFILHSLSITSDKDLNDYYYYDGCLEKLKLDLVIPGSVKVIGGAAFRYKSFKTIIINEGVEEIESYAFCDCQAKEIKLPSTVSLIDQNAFASNNISYIYISNKVKYISGNSFADCNFLSKIYLDENNEFFETNDSKNVLIEKENRRLVVSLKGSLIPEGVKIIGTSCFSWLNEESELVIPNGVEKIEDNAFEGCDFTNVIFPETLVEIGNYVFYSCKELKKIVFPKNLRKIGYQSFDHCYNLAEVYFNSSVDIGKYCFDYKTKLFNADGTPMK